MKKPRKQPDSTHKHIIKSFYDGRKPSTRHMGGQTVVTLALILCLLLLLFPSVFVRITPEIFTILIYGTIAQAIISLVLGIIVVFTDIGKLRPKYVLYGIVPLFVSFGIAWISLLLLRGYITVSPVYSTMLERYQSIQLTGIEKMIGTLLMTTLNLEYTWRILCQFAATLISYTLWIANFINLIHVGQDIYNYDGAVTFQDQWLRKMAIMIALALIFTLVISIP